MACGLSGYLLGVNPFNQPGVEAYKKNMFALLDKPGYERSPGRSAGQTGRISTCVTGESAVFTNSVQCEILMKTC